MKHHPSQFKKNHLSIYFFCVSCAGLLVFAALFASVTAKELAEHKSTEIFALDGVVYTKDQIIEDFLNVAFSDLPWNADAGEEDRLKITSSFEAIYPKAQRDLISEGWLDPLVPWLSKHRFQYIKGPLNERNKINKWENRPLTFAVDWPRYSEEITVQGPKTPYTVHEEDQYYQKFIDIIQSQVNTVSESSKLKAELIPPEDERDYTETYGRIRIIPNLFWSVRGYAAGPGGYIYHPAEHEEELVNGVLFQSYNYTYFDGYLLPLTNQILDLSVCKVNPTLQSDILRALIVECMVRSLGFPGIAHSAHSIMSDWHKQNERPVHAFQNISEYDQLLISLLYCPPIKSGMSKTEVEKILREDSACFIKK